MPGFNGTGPSGNGPMTGKRMGRCAAKMQNSVNNNSVRNIIPGNSVNRQGAGTGFGIGRCGSGMYGIGRRRRLWS